jgi:hypothetical protein
VEREKFNPAKWTSEGVLWMHLQICPKCENRRLHLQQGQLLDVVDNDAQCEEGDILYVVPQSIVITIFSLSGFDLLRYIGDHKNGASGKR